jgi:diguanylate cyclase (GGDEF)-like protein/PAS domain S-box-containing protein
MSKHDNTLPTESDAPHQHDALLEQLGKLATTEPLLFRHIADAAPVLIYIFDLHAQHLIYVNHWVYNLVGYTPEEVLARGFGVVNELLHPDDQPAMLQLLANAAQRGSEVIEQEQRAQHADGSWRWLLTRDIIFARDDNGQPTLLLGTASDITRHKEEEAALRDSRNRIHSILESMSDGFFALGSDWRFTYVNREAERLLQRTSNDMIGQDIWNAYPELAATEFYSQAHMAAAESASTSFEMLFAPSRRWLKFRISPAGEGLSVYMHDTTDSRVWAAQLQFQASALAQVHDAVVAVDTEQRITYWNDEAERLYGWSRDEALGRTLLDVCQYRWFQPEDEHEAAEMLATTGTWRGENIHRTRSNTDIIVESSVSMLTDASGTPTGTLAVLRDITRQKRTQDLLEWRALHDTLTELPNRLLFLDRLSMALERLHTRDSTGCAVLFLDLDNFKVVNDSLGHMVGDRMLITVARKLQTCVPEGAMLARFGGDEFLLLLEQIQSTADVMHLAEHIQRTLETPIVLDNHRQMVSSASIGIAFGSASYREPEDMLRDANVAMHHAKRQGGAHAQVFDSTMSARARERLWIETELRQALEREELIPFYQPIVSLTTGELVGFEVLVRWRHPQRGLLLPGSFISIAEETGLIGALDQWVLRAACHQAHLWVQQYQLAPTFTINVNVSGREFFSAELAHQIAAALEESNLAPYRLKLEITERVAMDHAEAAVTTLQTLRSLGVQMALDDFGMGYSSLRYLPRFPIQTLKVDRSFVSKIEQDNENETIVRTIVTMAHSLGLDVVAEGIETQAHQLYLEMMDCDYGQGFLYSRPIEPASASQLLDRQGKPHQHAASS